MSHPQLHKVAASPAVLEWARTCPDGTYNGMCRVETRHATYLFRNGKCFAVSGRGMRAGTTSADLVGMKLSGWLLPEADPSVDSSAKRRLEQGGIRVSRHWRAGARAVLYGRAGWLGAMRIALTSPAEGCIFYDGAPARPPSFDISGTGSLTRVGLPLPAAG